MEYELKCNFKKCRKQISEIAWVTSCSHIFCNEDGTREFKKDQTCPACSTKLPGKLDVVRMEISPSEQYKSIVLAGLSPDVIMDIATRAISFWAYQCNNELVYQMLVENKEKERCTKIEQIYTQATNNFRSEMTSIHQELEVSKSEIDQHRQRCSELSEKLLEKTRQLQKVQAMYEGMRRKCVSPEFLEQSRRSTIDKAANKPDCISRREDQPFASSNQIVAENSGFGLGTIPENLHARDFKLQINQQPAAAESMNSRFAFPSENSSSTQRPPRTYDFHPGSFSFAGP